MSNFVKIINVKINTFRYPKVIELIGKYLTSAKQNYIVTPNPEFILEAIKDPGFAQILNQADLSVADGNGLLWAAKYNSLSLTQIPVVRHLQAFFQMIYSLVIFAISREYAHSVIPENITGVDLVADIAKICSKKQKSIFLLGAAPGVAKEAALRLKHIYPDLIVSGTYGGPKGVWQKKYDQKIINKLKKHKPDCLLVAYGAPKQEKWINRNLPKLPFVKMAIGIGGSFDFIAEKVSMLGGSQAIRAPKWLRNMKLEWLHRLWHQPDRINRIFNAVVLFPAKIMIHKIRERH